MIRFGRLAGFAAVALTALGGVAHAQTQLKVIVFPGMSNLMQFAAQAQGFYAARPCRRTDLHAEFDRVAQRSRRGRYHIAHGGVDNAVAQVETAKVDLFVFMGGNNGNNSLYVQPDIRSYNDLRGKIVGVDAPTRRSRCWPTRCCRRRD